MTLADAVAILRKDLDFILETFELNVRKAEETPPPVVEEPPEDPVIPAPPGPPAPSGEVRVATNLSGISPPNIVVARDFLEGKAGDPIHLLDPEIEQWGNGTDCRYGEVDGRITYQPHRGGRENGRLSFVPGPFRRFRFYYTIYIPEGACAPSRDNFEPNTWQGGSSWKPVWFMLGPDGHHNNNVDPDLCIFTHASKGNLQYAGNTIEPQSRWDGFPKGFFDWGHWNGVGYVQDCHPTSPSLGRAPVEHQAVNSQLKNFVQNFNQRPFQADPVIADAKCFYDRFNCVGWSDDNRLGKTIVHIGQLYLAIEKDGKDWYQAVAVGNASHFDNCTRLEYVKPLNWDNDGVSFDVPPGPWTHYHIIRGPGDVVSGKL